MAVYNIVGAGQVQLLYLCTLLNESSIASGAETQDVRLFAWSEIPWSELAFPTVEHALRFAIQHLEHPTFAPQTLTKMPDGSFM
mmetsp:Transcript_6291/g.16786  ORF Transcript_6291/g.16786 Transcript_6291/m.16786 type:complete len:84 (+) Transcript_6291:719-970(+)